MNYGSILIIIQFQPVLVLEVLKNLLYLSHVILFIGSFDFHFMNQAKPRVIKDFEKLEPAIQEQIKLTYQQGFSQHLITFTNKDGNLVSALPFETEEKYYLVRMTINQAVAIVEGDDDYDDDGMLTDVAKDELSDKHPDTEPLIGDDFIDDGSDDY